MEKTKNETIQKSSVYFKDNILHTANDEFITLTGYKNDDITGKSLIELSKLLKINNNRFFKDGNTLYKGYIFTNQDVPKHVEITYEYSDKDNETIYSFKENSSEFLDGLLSTCNDGHRDDIEAVAIYSYPDLVCLKANTNCINKWHLLDPKSRKDSNLAGTIYSPLKPNLLIDIKGKGYHYVNESKFIDKQGNTSYWTVKSTLIYEKGEAKYLKCSFIDQTEKVLAKKTVKKQKTEMETILDNIPDSIVKLNNKGEYTYANKMSLSEFAPYRSDDDGELNNKKIYKHFKYNNINGRELSFDEAPDVRVLNGEILTNYTIIGTSNLSTTYHECSGTPLYDHEGNIEGAVLIYRNIEPLIKLEEYDALAESIKHIDINYTTISYRDFKIKYMNESALESLRMTHPHVGSLIDVIGDNFFDYYSSNSDERENIIAGINLCIKEQSSRYIHTQKIFEKGEIEYIKTIFQPVFDENNQVKRITCVGMYITDEELANKQMTKSLKAQEEIFTNTSHELKTPINLFFSASQLTDLYLKADIIEDGIHKIKDNNQIIMQNCYRTIKLINNILDISRIEQGLYELNLENINIVDVIDDIVDSVSDYIKDNKLRVIFDPQVEEKIIALDLYKFERIMLNLISNAIKFSKDEGTIFISLVDKGSTVEVSVKDQGIGIDKKNMQCLFNKFKQENKSLNRQAEGTGIGLSLVKSIVEPHEGTIYLESTIDVGSKFIITLPSKTLDNSVMLHDEYIFENRAEMIKFEFSDIYN